jgi:hypothetical protein
LTEFLRGAIRYFLYIGVCLFGVIYELIQSETVRWPLIGGYLLVIAASLYRMRAQRSAEDENARD